MSSPIQVTPEMRKAVYESDCARLGHIFHLGYAIGTLPSGAPILEGPSEDELPFITCSRCSKVWLIVEEPGDDYDDAETKLQAKLKTDDPLSKKMKEQKDRRHGNGPKVKKEK